MKKSLSTLILILFSVFCFAFVSQSILAATESGTDTALKGLNTTAGKAFGDTSSGMMKSVPGAIGTIVGSLLAFIGVIFFILIVYGGFLWMTAAGNDAQVGKAKDLISAAIIGLVIVLMAYAITSYVGKLLTE
jgi:hypothetical protein